MAVAPDGLSEVHGADDLLERQPRRRLERFLAWRRPGIEQRPGLGIDRRRVLSVPFERFEHVSPVEAGELLPWAHTLPILTGPGRSSRDQGSGIRIRVARLEDGLERRSEVRVCSRHYIRGIEVMRRPQTGAQMIRRLEENP